MTDQDAQETEVLTPKIDAAEAVEPEILDEVDSDSSPDTGEDQEKKQNGVQSRINELTAKRYEEQRRAEAAEAKARELEEQLKSSQTPAPSIEAPQLPEDLFDAEAMRKYHADMTAYAAQVAQSASKQTWEERQQQEQQATAQQAQQQKISTYAANAVRDGVDIEKLRAAEATLNAAGISPVLGDFLMTDQNGGKICEYLHDNPAELAEVLNMDPVRAAIKVDNDIRKKAMATAPRVSNAPEPPDDIVGSGALVKDEFERENPGTTFI